MDTNGHTAQQAAEHTAAQTDGLVERYIAIWNESDATRRRALIEQTLTDNASFRDPLMHGTGHSGIEAMLAAAQPQFAGLHCQLRGAVDAHHNYVRFSWDLAPAGGEAVVGGTDFATLAADGRMQTVVGFFDFMPTTTA